LAQLGQILVVAMPDHIEIARAKAKGPELLPGLRIRVALAMD